MIRAAVQIGDGTNRGRRWLGSVVETIQIGLIEAGFALEADGRFGRKTLEAIKAFQRAQGLLSIGVGNKATWSALAPHIERATTAKQESIRHQLVRFYGDLEWVHQQEGHRGRPYWPGGASGVTLDPGVDLGYADLELVRVLYGPLLTARQQSAVGDVAGYNGNAAKEALRATAGLSTIRITEDQAREIMPVAVRPYWLAIKKRFPSLARAATLPSVQTVLLSLAYNRGPGNRHLEPLRPLLDENEWLAVAEKVHRMQQNHRLKGIRIRRRQEAALIRAEIEFLES